MIRDTMMLASRGRKSRSFRLLAVAAGLAATSGSANACIVSVPPRLEDASYADLVVIGQIENYRIIRDEAFRREMLARPNLSPEDRKHYENPKTSLLSDYARFEIKVESVLAGHASGTLSVTWDNSTFGEPDQTKPGRYLIALRRPGSASPPLRGPSATILPSPDPSALTVLQAPCSGAFIYEAESNAAQSIQEILTAKRK